MNLKVGDTVRYRTLDGKAHTAVVKQADQSETLIQTANGDKWIIPVYGLIEGEVNG